MQLSGSGLSPFFPQYLLRDLHVLYRLICTVVVFVLLGIAIYNLLCRSHVPEPHKVSSLHVQKEVLAHRENNEVLSIVQPIGVF